MPEHKLQPSSDPDVTASRFPARTKLIALTHMSNVTGTVVDVGAVARGTDVDKPRNLAKSVTVE